MDHRSYSDHHKAAAKAIQRALPALRTALREEGNLEWAGAIREIVKDVEHVSESLTAYATLAEMQ